MSAFSFQQLAEHLQQWDRRRRRRDALVWLPRGVLGGLLVAVLIAAAARFRPLLTNEELPYVAVGLPLLGLLGSVAILLVQRRSLLAQARFADRTFALQERASAAVEIESGRLAVPSALARQQIADAVQAAGAVDASRTLPLRLNRQDWLVIMMAVALLLAAVWLPNPQSAILRAERAFAATIEEQADTLEALAQEIEENPALSEEQKRELQEPVQSALEALEQGDLSREEAVAVLSEAEAELRELSRANNVDELLQQLQTAGQSLAEDGAGQSLGEALQRGNLSQAGASAAALADDLPGLSQGEQDALAEDLEQTSAQLENIDGELSQQLAEAAEALREGDVASAQEALREASGTLQERAQERAAGAQAAEAAGELNEGRQEVAQAGQGEGESRDQGASADGQQDAGAAQGEGGGESGQGQGSGEGDGAGAGIGGTGGEEGHAESVFVPDFVDLSEEAGEDVELPAECIADPESCGALLNESPTEFGDESSTVPYDQVFGDYRDAAYEALDEDYVPLGMKGYIRDYFSSLEP